MMDDLISRRDAINVVSEITTTMSVCINKDECYGMKRMQKQAITELENMSPAEPEHPDINAGNMDVISRQQAIDALRAMQTYKMFAGDDLLLIDQAGAQTELMMLPSAQPERKTGHWILNRSGAYCCNKCMEPCATYTMMKPRDKFCKMCGAKMKEE